MAYAQEGARSKFQAANAEAARKARYQLHMVHQL